jgi:hypothetical protein
MSTEKIQKTKNPTCKVQGYLPDGGICGKIIVGMKQCGYGGECKYKLPPDLEIKPT